MCSNMVCHTKVCSNRVSHTGVSQRETPGPTWVGVCSKGVCSNGGEGCAVKEFVVRSVYSMGM